MAAQEAKPEENDETVDKKPEEAIINNVDEIETAKQDEIKADESNKEETEQIVDKMVDDEQQNKENDVAEKPKSDNMEEIEANDNNDNNDNNDQGRVGKESDDEIIAASKDIKYKSEDVVVVEAKVDHDNALLEEQQKEEKEEDDDNDNDNDNDNNLDKSEAEIHEISIPSLISIKFDVSNYLSLKYKKDAFALYVLSICCDTESQTSWNLFFRYSDLDRFCRKLEYLHNRLCKFNDSLKKTLIFPRIPPKKQWQRNKLDKEFISERIRLLNIYVNDLTKYVTSSSIKIQDLYLDFFEINNLYKYIRNDDIEMLDELNKYNEDLLIKIDSNKSNIFHYAVCCSSIKSINWLLSNINNKCEIIKLLISKDQYHWTPLTLCKYFKNDEIYNKLKEFYDSNNDENGEEKEDNINIYRLPAQYKYNVNDPKSYKRHFWIIINPLSGTGIAEEIWNDLIFPFLDFYNDSISYDVLITTKQFDAQKQCELLSLDAYNKYNGIICLGGDGTIAEVINGLYHNTNIPNVNMDKFICPIPCGSGNALAKELNIENIINALKKLFNGFETVIDAYLAKQIGINDTYSFVSTQWGAISSIDLDSESFRWMGSFRFTLKGISEVAWSSHYKARLYFKTIKKLTNDEINNNQTFHRDKDRIPNNDENWWQKLTNLHLDDDEMHKVEEVPLNDIEEKKQENKDENKQENEAEIDKEDDDEKNKEEKKEEEDIDEIASYPSDWICIEGEFGLLCVTNLQWIAEDTCMGGNDFNAKTNTLRLVYNLKTGRMNYASALLGLDTGKHLQCDHVYYYDVDQVVIEPLTKGPPIDVDGERKPLKPVYVKLLPSDFVVIC